MVFAQSSHSRFSKGRKLRGVALDARFDGDLGAQFRAAVFVGVFDFAGFGQQVVVAGGADLAVAKLRKGGEFLHARDVYEMAGFFIASVA